MPGECLLGKTALITGGTRGIGLAIARGFQNAGATVWIHGKEAADPALLREFDDRYIAVDLADSGAAAAIARDLAGATERLDILVNNAGVETIMPIEQLDPAVLALTWRINAQAPLELIHALMPLLKGHEASVINVTSIHEATPYPGNVAYCMSKAALAMATKVASIELAKHAIRLNNLAPGAIETDINRAVIDTIGRDRWAEWIPAGRVGSTDEVVGPALFLASNASRYMSGSTIFVDGAYRENLVRYRPDGLH